MKVIPEKLFIPVSVMATSVGLIAAGAAWATAMQLSVNAQAGEISSLKSDNKKVLDSLARIEGRLGIQQPHEGGK